VTEYVKALAERDSLIRAMRAAIAEKDDVIASFGRRISELEAQLAVERKRGTEGL
jgi:hypothetical protein